MQLKMSELVTRSGVSKSTILYYIKEGLLPQPRKPKPNVHLYDEKTLHILEFIKYFQEHLGYSIAQIKEILQDNRIDFDSDSSIVLGYLSAMQNRKREQEASTILEEARSAGIDMHLIEAYEQCASELAKKEYEMGAQLLKNNSENRDNRLQKVIFDIILTLKPHIFNRATLEEHKRRLNAFLKKEQGC